MTPVTGWRIVPWETLSASRQQALTAHSELYTGRNPALWSAVNGELRYLIGPDDSQLLPLFVTRRGPCTHAQAFFQGLPVFDSMDARNFGQLLPFLRTQFTKATVVDFGSVFGRVSGWQTSEIETEIIPLSAAFEPPDPDLRSELRKAAREGLNVTRLEREADLDEVITLFAQHGKQSRKLYPREFLRELAVISLTQDDLLWLVARHEQQIVASQLFVRVGTMLLYWLSVMDRSAAPHKPAVALLNEGIRTGISRGLHTCNLGWTPPTKPGLLAFKRRWGSSPHRYAIHTASPWWLLR